MRGIAGLRLKNPDLYPRLGELIVPMLDVLASRGPDSTGVAVYCHDTPPGQWKSSLCAPGQDYHWAGYVSALEAADGVVPVDFRPRGRDGGTVTSIGPDRGPALMAGIDPSVRLFGYGAAIEVYKDVGPAAEVCARYGIDGESLAVVRDSFACKPMVVAETADYVAVAPEYVALADLPGVDKAEVFEPMPQEIYTWQG